MSGNSQENQPWALIQLPPFPAIAMRVLKLLARENVGMKELTREIQGDPALSAEVLTLANSVLFGFRSDIKTILHAVVMLGSERVKAIALTVAMKTYLTQSFQIPALLACWRHSLACAFIAEELAAVSIMDKDLAYTAGLLHDVGRLALGLIKPFDYANMLASRDCEPVNVLDRERELFGVDHCQAGEWLVEAWKLPKPFGEVTAHHHEAKHDRFDIVALVHITCLMADAIGFEAVHSAETPGFEQILKQLPHREQERFRPDSKQLTMRVAMKINSLE